MFKILGGIEWLKIATFLFMDFATVRGISNFYFSKPQHTCARYGKGNLLWRSTSRSLLDCAHLCGKQNTGCVSFLFDRKAKDCYGFRTGLPDHTDNLISVDGAKYFQLNGYSKITTWKLVVWTGTEDYSGTDHRIIVSIYDTNGAILDKELKDHGDEFEIGKVDQFQFSGESIEIPQKINFLLQTKAGGGNNADWLLSKVTLQNTAMTVFTAMANKWFSLGDTDTFNLTEICD